MHPAPATVTIFRDTPDDVQDRWVRIFIDDAPEEILRYGERLTREGAPGRHRIKAHNTLNSDTIELDRQGNANAFAVIIAWPEAES